MSILNFFIFVIFFPYLILILLFWYKWEKYDSYTPKNKSGSNDFVFISIVIALRNEEKNVVPLIASLERQIYPKHHFEIILINDQSEDRTLDLLYDAQKYSSLNITILSNTGNYTGKKMALQKGIDKAKGELIVQTDADCLMPEEWIKTIAEYYRDYQPDMILAPVRFTGGKSLLSSFQKFENAALMGVTAGSARTGSPVLANGANMVYKRKLVISLQNPSRSKIYSGDDIFLTEQIKKKKNKSIHFLKSEKATIMTPVTHSFRSFWQQRKRWIQKSRYYKGFNLIFSSLVIFLGNLAVVLGLIEAIVTGDWWPFIALFAMKISIDATLVSSVSKFLNVKMSIIPFLLSLLIYPFYVFILALSMNFGKIEWKNRNIR